jgi:hypothetical protein
MLGRNLAATLVIDGAMTIFGVACRVIHIYDQPLDRGAGR